MIVELDTPRLKLRQWQERDRVPFAALNADPQVMEFFPELLDRSASDAFLERLALLIAERGWGFWAVEFKPTQALIGLVGLHQPLFELPCSPCVEVGWRLAREFWGQGLATEAAQEAIRFGFEQLQLPEIVSFTSVLNQRSQAVMERLKMQRDPHTFEHPLVPVGHPLREHCLYRLPNLGQI
jgi:RimJ/RimL family protein N-acetyltransferase